MRLKSIEPTPNPNSMKLNLEEKLPPGVKTTYVPGQPGNAPGHIRRLLEIPGVKSLYRCLDFLAVQRIPSAEWEDILSRARAILSGEGGGNSGSNGGGQDKEGAASPNEGADPDSGPLGQVKIFIQFFRRIPMLVKVQTGANPPGEYRANLPPRFAEAVRAATPSAPNMLMERRWVPVEPRTGELREVGDSVAAELDASYPRSRLDDLIRQAFERGADAEEKRRQYTAEERAAMLASQDWKQRFAAIESLGADPGQLETFKAALRDPHVSVRRQAAIYLGLFKDPDAVLEPLCGALGDKAAVVRRTAADALNDLGDARAAPAVAPLLKDPNKLVRWRAARFLYELGDESALPALRAAADDPHFEVRLQIAQAIERIAGGEAAAGPVWMRMTRG